MAADASIYSMIRPAAAPAARQSPFEEMGAMMQLKAMGDSSQLHNLQRRKLEDDLVEEGAFKSAIKDWVAAGGKGELPAEALSASPSRFTALQKQRLDGQKTQAELGKLNLEVASAKAKDARDSLASVRDQASFDAWRQYALEKGYRIAEQAPPVFDPNWQRSQLLTADKHLEETAPKYEYKDIGGKLQLVQMNPRAAAPAGPVAGQDITKTATPDALLTDERTRTEGDKTRALTKRGQDLVDARAREQADRDKFGQPYEVTGPDGKPKLVMSNKSSGEVVDVNTRQPVAGIGPKQGETAQKQQTGVQNTRAALTQYREALKDFSLTDLASPDARAKMGTVYNNAMLQAKEAFNLGVLNGPDLKILEQVLTPPTSLKGGLTSKAALDAQAAKLDEIMARIGSQVSATQSGQPVVEPPKPAQPTTFDAMPDPAKFNGRRIRSDDGTLYKSDGKKWLPVKS